MGLMIKNQEINRKILLKRFPHALHISTYGQEDKRMDKRKQTGKLLIRLQKHNGWGCSHSIRVSRYAVEIGKNLGLDEKEVNELFTAALLHDIGKLFIPAKILDKDKTLTKAEYQIVKWHIRFGYLLLKVLGYPENICKAVENHHERYDGKGYQKKKDAGLFAEIIGVADAYDAMKNGRPYRDKMESFEIFCAMATASGKQFNPDVWEAMSCIVFPQKRNPYATVIETKRGVFAPAPAVITNDKNICRLP